MEVITKPPNNTEAESCVLGAMLLDTVGCAEGLELLCAKDFYLPSHRTIFKAIGELFEESKPPDLVVLKDYLQAKGMLNKAGGVDFISNIVESVPISGNLKYYAGIVREKSTARKLMFLGNEVVVKIQSGMIDIDMVIEQAERSLSDIGRTSHYYDMEPWPDTVEKVYEEIMAGKKTGIKTGYTVLDNLTRGLQGGDLIVIAARPSMGKTTFALNMLNNACFNFKKSVLVFSLEMGSQQLTKNLLAIRTGLPGNKISIGGDILTELERAAISKCSSDIRKMPLTINDCSFQTPLSIKSIIRRTLATQPVHLVIIDYLQLMSSGNSKENRQQEITYISRHLKAVAREFHIPLVVLSQLSRAPETRENHRPRLSDLRESGAIEQDADLVILLYRDEYYHDTTTDNMEIAELNLAKQRNGETSSCINLKFKKECLRFLNPEDKFDGL